MFTPLFADFTYNQTSRVTGGQMVQMMKYVPGGGKALQPTNTVHYLKGNRMAAVSDREIRITDLDKETITTIDLKEKTYSVLTFAEMQQFMQEMASRMGQPQPEGGQMNFKMDVQETGNTKTIQDVQTKEFILKVTMEATDQKSGQSGSMVFREDMWMAPEVPGYDEVRKFHIRMGEKLGMGMGGQMGPMMRPGMGEGMARLAKEAAKLKGVPIYTVTHVEGVGMPEGADAPRQRSGGGEESSQSTAAPPTSIAGAVAGGLLGGFGKKKKAPQQEQSDAPPPSQGGAGMQSLMEITGEMNGFSTAPVDPSTFDVPAGFKQVESPMKRGARKMNRQ